MPRQSLVIFVGITLLSFSCQTDNSELILESRFKIDEQKYNEAILLLDSAIDNSPTFEAYLLRGRSYFHLGETSKAEISLIQAVEIDSKNYEPWMHLGNVYVNKGLYSKALNAYNKAIENNDRIGKMYMNRGNIFFHFKRYSEAEDDFKIAIDFDPTDPQPHFNYGRSLYMQEKFPNALESFIESIQLNDSAESTYWLGVTYYQLKQIQNACKFLRLATDKGDENAKQALATICNSK